MKKTQYEQQRQIANLIPIVELCIPLIEKLDRTKGKLSLLPRELESLQEKARFIEQYTSEVNFQTLSSYSTRSSILQQNDLDRSSKLIPRSQAEETELELDYVVNHLDEILAYLTNFKQEIDNIVVLKERLEALQEARLESITPERIYVLLEKQKSAALDRETTHSSSHWQKLRDKIAGYPKFDKLVKTTAIAVGIISCFSIISYYSAKDRQQEQNTIEETQTSAKPSVNLELLKEY